MYRKFISFLALASLFISFSYPCFGAKMGQYRYSDFKKPKKCGMCHRAIYNEWKDSLMAKSFTHSWDEVEYFKLALPHAKKLEKVSGVKAGCIACHGPLAFLSGDIPPKKPEKNTRANEGVSCEICHQIKGTTEKEPYNFSFIIKPSRTKLGPRKDAKAIMHNTKFSSFTRSSMLCATCHDEMSPYGAWVKETYREWKNGPYYREGVRCQDCHMSYFPGKSAGAGKRRPNIAHHTFQGAHSRSKLRGAVDLAIYTKRRVRPGAKMRIKVLLFNGKVGHFIPSGSTEERMLWLEVWAKVGGKRYHIPVDRKGFKGEKYTIADSGALAYQAMGEIMGIKGFKGIGRDGNVPSGARIFRRPFFDPKGRMTICQWYTKRNDIVDYRIGPRETKIETYTWSVPEGMKGQKIEIDAKLFYSLVPSSVGEFLHLPKSEYEKILVNEAKTFVYIK